MKWSLKCDRLWALWSLFSCCCTCWRAYWASAENGPCLPMKLTSSLCQQFYPSQSRLSKFTHRQEYPPRNMFPKNPVVPPSVPNNHISDQMNHYEDIDEVWTVLIYCNEGVKFHCDRKPRWSISFIMWLSQILQWNTWKSTSRVHACVDLELEYPRSRTVIRGNTQGGEYVGTYLFWVNIQTSTWQVAQLKWYLSLTHTFCVPH